MEKIPLGSKPLLFPMPATIVGANVDGKPNFMTIAYCGIVNANPTMVAIGSNPNHFTKMGIDQNRTFSVNIPSVDLVKETDYIGIYSGREVDKSKIFDVFYGELKSAPMIRECPINLECKVKEQLDIGGTDTIIIGKVVESYCNEKYLTNNLPDVTKFNPLVYCPGIRQYWNLGTFIGDAWNIGKDLKKE